MNHATDAAADGAVSAFIDELATKSSGTDAEETWYCIAACAFAACNQGQYVADVFRAAIRPYAATDYAQHQHVLRRLKESLLKTGIIYGIPRVINAFRALVAALPGPASNETSSVRAHIATPATTDARGLAYMRNIFRADLDPFVRTMDAYWPDLRTLVVTTIYGYYQSDVSVVDAVTTSQLNIAALVPMDVTAEVAWHMRGLIRNGGTEDQLRFAFDTTLQACRLCDVRLKNEMPRAEDVIHEERLF